MANNSVPSQVPLVGNNGTVSPAWLAFFTDLGKGNNGNGNGSGNGGYVEDATSSSYAPAVFAQGVDTNKGVAVTGSVYFAIDTLKLYVAQNGVWKQLTPSFTGDVTSVPGGSALSLVTVNNTPGTFGTPFTVPRVQVDAKGRVIHVEDMPISYPPQVNQKEEGLTPDLVEAADTLIVPSRNQHITVGVFEVEGVCTVLGTVAVI